MAGGLPLAAVTRILVLAPHPDDEIVGFAARIARQREAGASVSVLFLTDGVPAAEVLWPWQRRRRPAWVARRRAEAEAVAALLGLDWHGFVDIPTRRLKDEFAKARAAVLAAIAGRRIDHLWAPAYEGGHQDHDTASFLGHGLAGAVTVFEAPLYTFAGGRVRTQTFIDGPEGEVLILSPVERAEKRRLLALYASERGNLDYVGLDSECLRPLVGYDYARPPHPGRAFYQRFQWVPFRHPRIDFTTPEAVCRRLATLCRGAGEG